jgi:hypothetical protein
MNFFSAWDSGIPLPDRQTADKNQTVFHGILIVLLTGAIYFPKAVQPDAVRFFIIFGNFDIVSGNGQISCFFC